MLEVSELSVRYGRVIHALDDITLSVPDAGIVALLGSNGAGKTTLLRAISGTLSMHGGAVVAGELRYGGRSLTRLDPARVVRRGVVQVPEGRRIFGRLTVLENLKAGAITCRDRGAQERALRRVLGLFPVLAERRAMRAALLSGGEQQMLAIGRALMTSPKLLLLDEPSLGLAPQMVTRIGAIVQEISDQGTSVLLVEQNAAMALSVATDAYVLDVGRLSLAGSADVLASTDEVRDLYLGHGGHAEQLAVAGLAGGVAVTRSLSRWS
jgi:branched-chain amino acid transport system ATP-binding protein